MAHSGTTWLSSKFLQLVIQLHENQRGQIRLSGDLSEPFPISNGVKQGCVLAPTLFSIFFSIMRTWVMTRGYTSDTVWMAVSSIYDTSKPTPRHKRG